MLATKEGGYLKQPWYFGAERIQETTTCNEMNISHSMEWFQHKLLPNCSDKSVIIWDNAEYHNAVEEKIPTKSKKKKQQHQVPHETTS